MELSNSMFSNKKSDKEEITTNQNNNNEKIKKLPVYMDLYPPVKDLDFESPMQILQQTEPNIKKKKNITEESSDEKGFETYEMNEEFLESLFKRKSIFDKNKSLNTISKFIKNSKLIQKLESEYRSDKKIDLESLIRSCAKNLNYVKLKKGEILFKIGDLGDRFYFILNGKVNILKLKELNEIYLTYVEYLQYCIFLIEEKEEYILSEVTKKNRNHLDITYPEDIIKLYRVVFIKMLRENITNHFIQNNRQLKDFFNNYKQKMQDFRLSEHDLINLEEQKLKGVYGSTKEWEAYILKKVRPNIKESIFFEDYEEQFKDKTKKNITCYVYESFLYLGPGLFFGDFALDSEHNRRNATIRAEEKTILGWLKSVDYANMIAPKRKIEKYNEIMFLYKNFFFKHTNSHTFERKYFHLFPPLEINQGTILFNFGDIPKSLFFVKQGQISLEIKCSIFELHLYIRKIFESLLKNDFYKRIINKYKNKNYLIGEDEMKRLRKYLNEPIFFKLRDKSIKFREELEKKNKYKLSVLGGNEMIGIEEIFMGSPYLCTGEVVSKKLICYELTCNQLNIFLENEKNILGLYTKSSVNKIITLLDRLQNIKKNGIYMARLKYDCIKNNNEEQNLNNKEQMYNLEQPPNDNNKIVNIRKAIINIYNSNNDKNIHIEDINQDLILKNRILYNNINQRKNKPKKIYKNFSFVMESYKGKNNENSKVIYRNNNNHSIPLMKYKNNSNDTLYIGNKRIDIDKIKKRLNESNSFDKNKYLINKNENSKIFELSQCQYPLSEERYQIKDNDNDNKYEINKISNNKIRSGTYSKKKKRYINNKKWIMNEKLFFDNKIKTQRKFLKKINSGDFNNSKLPLSDYKRKINIININPEESPQKMKIIQTKDLLSEIIKDYYKEIKQKGYLSFISKRKTNTYYTRKLHDKYNNNNKDNKLENSSNNINGYLDNYDRKLLPKIIVNYNNIQDKNIQVTNQTFIKK